METSVFSRFLPEARPLFRSACSDFGVAVFLACAAGLLGACGEAPRGRGEVPESGEAVSADVVDWEGQAISIRAPGWSLEFCGGPFLCVSRGDEQVGSVELFRLPVHDHAVITGVLGGGGSEREALEAAAAEFHAVLSADRASGYGADYHLRADPPAAATVMGKPGLRVVLEGRRGDRVSERIVQYHVLDRDTLYLLAAMGTDGGGSLGEFETEHLRAFEPLFGAIAAASRVHPAGR